MTTATKRNSIGQYLIKRLQDYGIADMFGIPGDYVLSFYSMLEESPINVVGCTREDCAGFAADAYARMNGMGAVCVTYCVGGLSVCNSIAGAFAEKSPVVVISGSPGLAERVNNPLLHHRVREFHTQKDVFEKICIASCELNDPFTAFREIDRVLDTAARYKRPVYIELPRDMVNIVPQV
ncbi:MAG: thiamine pyrophosphate-binding protein, partial [bacterium]|nr:thiamine pyrophosphate-binding protein [bacterium]